MGSGNSVPVDNSWKQFQQMSQLFNQNNQNQRGFNVHMPVHLDKIVDLSRSYSVASEDELARIAKKDIVEPAVVRPVGTGAATTQQEYSPVAPLRELDVALEPLTTELEAAVVGSGVGSPQAAAQIGALDLDLDFSQKITLPTPLTVNWNADTSGIGAGISLSGFLAGLGGGAAVICLILLIMWKCSGRRSPNR